jgi:benzodiazapine receptor
MIRTILCVVLTLAIGGLSGIFTSSGVEGWYATINKPSFNPPNWVFGPVWTILYIMMGISLSYVVKAAPSPQRTTAIGVFLFQLALNFFWSLIFFKMERPDLALADIIALLVSIAVTIFLFYKINKTAAYLLIPYLCWVSFATVLNLSIYLLNR